LYSWDIYPVSRVLCLGSVLYSVGGDVLAIMNEPRN